MLFACITNWNLRWQMEKLLKLNGVEYDRCKKVRGKDWVKIRFEVSPARTAEGDR